jgi:hypothetical protein
LLGNHSVADVDPPALSCLVINLLDYSDELVTRYNLVLNVRRPRAISPEFRCALVTLDVAGADSNGLHADECLARPYLRDCNFLEPVVLRPVTDNSG